MSNASPVIRILLADDHAIFRSGIAALLAQRDDMQLVAQAGDGRSALALYRDLRPDITLMDLKMDGMDGIEAIEAILRLAPGARIIALTTYSSETLLQRALRAGACSYLMKSMLVGELFSTIRQVHESGRHLPPAVASMLAFSVHSDPLSPREIAVLTLAARGNSNKQIADALGIGEETVKGYMRTLFSKLGAADRTHAVVLALRHGIIDV